MQRNPSVVINGIGLGGFLLAGEALAHTGHGVPALHAHGWEYALLAVALAAAAAAWIRRKK